MNQKDVTLTQEFDNKLRELIDDDLQSIGSPADFLFSLNKNMYSILAESYKDAVIEAIEEDAMDDVDAAAEDDIASVLSEIDGPLFRQQRFDLMTAISALEMGIVSESQKDEKRIVNSLCGIQALLDLIADIAHDHYGIDCLLTSESIEEV